MVVMFHECRNLIGFNPYRVFEYVATNFSPIEHGKHWLVSIPIGFSSTLQLLCDCRRSRSLLCFNPYRVFEYVATVLWLCRHHKANTFQSLSGFRVRCNHGLIACASFCSPVSIPIGFSSTLQLRYRYPADRSFSSFNPYRVFEYVATKPETMSLQP